MFTAKSGKVCQIYARSIIMKFLFLPSGSLGQDSFLILVKHLKQKKIVKDFSREIFPKHKLYFLYFLRFPNCAELSRGWGLGIGHFRKKKRKLCYDDGLNK